MIAVAHDDDLLPAEAGAQRPPRSLQAERRQPIAVGIIAPEATEVEVEEAGDPEIKREDTSKQ